MSLASYTAVQIQKRSCRWNGWPQKVWRRDSTPVKVMWYVYTVQALEPVDVLDVPESSENFVHNPRFQSWLCRAPTVTTSCSRNVCFPLRQTNSQGTRKDSLVIGGSMEAQGIGAIKRAKWWLRLSISHDCYRLFVYSGLMEWPYGRYSPKDYIRILTWTTTQ